MVKLLLAISAVFLAASSALALDCAHRDYGHGSTVCVCTAAHCDSIAPVTKTAHGVVTSYLTSKMGDRFTKSQKIHFVKSQPTHVAPALTVTIDHAKKYQKIIGFGGTFTDTAGYNILKLHQPLQSRLMKDYFAADGLEYSIGRIPIAGSDASFRAYSYDDHPHDDTLSKFALQSEDLQFKIPLLKEAEKLSPHKLLWYGSAWSPPAWMKTNNKIINGGFLIGQPGSKFYKMFAKYLVKFVEEYHKHKVEMWGMTVLNEPFTGFNPHWPWNSLGLNSTMERDFIRLDLGPELHKAGFTKEKLKLMFYDQNLPEVKGWADLMMADEAAKYVSGLAFHWYSNSQGNWKDLDYIHEKYKDHLFVLATEANEAWGGHREHVYLGSWLTFNRYAEDIIQNMNHFTTGWTDWCLALDTHGGPNYVNNFVDPIIVVNETSQEYYKQPSYYALGHFSKFLPRDSHRVHHDVKGTVPDVMLTTFQRPDGATVLTVLNKGKHAALMQVHDPQHGYFDVSVKGEAMETLIWY